MPLTSRGRGAKSLQLRGGGAFLVFHYIFLFFLDVMQKVLFVIKNKYTRRIKWFKKKRVIPTAAIQKLTGIEMVCWGSDLGTGVPPGAAGITLCPLDLP